MLTEADRKYWPPAPNVQDYIASRIPTDATVLDVGPGHAPFRRATMSVDFVDVPGIRMAKCDLAVERMPFDDKSFDFVYCRHLLEDSWNPFAVCAEIQRVGKAGYIETPSPIAELCRGVDGTSPPYRGYHHHRFMLWVAGDRLHAISKYPLVEYLRFDEDHMAGLLRGGAKYWNTYYFWSGSIDLKHRQAPQDFIIPRDYATVLHDAMQASRVSTDALWTSMQARVAA